MKKLMFAAASCAALVFGAGAAVAEEGMWLPSQTPALGAALKKAGLKIDPAALGDLQKAPLNAIVSIGGCSAAFVSPEGLVATNHHCVEGSIQYNSKPGANYLEDGFLAKELKDELPAAPGTRVFVIEDLVDVTAAITNDTDSAGPVTLAKVLAVTVKMPAPITTATPKTVRSHQLRSLRSLVATSSVSRMDCSTDFVRLPKIGMGGLPSAVRCPP